MNNIDRFDSDDIASFADAYFDYLKQILDQIDRDALRKFVETIRDARDRGATVFLMGNGGSAATASHFANDFCFGTGEKEAHYRFFSLTDNIASITALGNDFGYDQIFVKQLEVFAKPDDVLIGISASGNSPNLVNGFEYGKKKGLALLALTGFDGGQLKTAADVCIHVPTQKNEYGPTEDAHMILDHLISNFLSRSN